ncbi:MAG: xanthine phosphoribosyltransferase [Erysipelotrichaceae bacterium]|nr:xanthine phosphoribosyltransferase [Erysipelotrichaceae bacterium]
MKILEERILSDGIILGGDILKIDNFLNHQIDVVLTDQMGQEFYRLFGEGNVNKILTIESSGIALAVSAAKYFNNCPVVFAKKGKSANVGGDVFECVETSYTRGVEYHVQVSKRYLNEGDRVLILDDFLANGEALNALTEICKQAGATVVGCGVAVTKSYQPGEQRIIDKGYRVESLARIKSMHDGKIEFMG